MSKKVDFQHRVFWLERHVPSDTHCFKAVGSKPEWDGQSWQGSSDSHTTWYYTTYESLEDVYKIDFLDYMPGKSELLEVVMEDGGIFKTCVIKPPTC
jgi:hypothetical protein